jgi:hypothetical protein
MAEKGKWAGCLKYGCFGCLGVVAVGLVFGAVMVGLVLMANSKESRFEPVDLARQVQPNRIDRIHPVEGESGNDPLLPSAPPIADPGRIVLDITMCRFDVEPGPAGEPIRVQGQYDVESFELTEDYVPDGENGWTYELSFRRRSLISLFVEQDGKGNRLRLIVPRDLPFVLEGSIGVGESRMELGGLRLLDTDLELGVGAHELSFSEPLAEPTARLHLDGSMGETRIIGLGNASPTSFRFDHSIGETLVDLSGEWRNDATIIYRCGLGACNLRAPDDNVGLILDDAGVMIGESNLRRLQDWPEPPPGSPTLTLSITASIGEVSVRR